MCRSIASAPSNIIEIALRNGLQQPTRAWLLARTCDAGGTGHLREEAFRSFLKELGVRKSAASDWIHGLIRSPFAHATVTKHGDQVIVLTSMPDLLTVFRVPKSTIDAGIPVNNLIGRRYKRALLTMARLRFEGSPMARNTIRTITGVSPSTQRRAEQDHRAEVTENKLRLQITPHNLKDLPAADHPAVRVVGNELIVQLPNTTAFPTVGRRQRRRHCSDQRAEQATRGSRRYYDSPDRVPASPWNGRSPSISGGSRLIREGGQPPGSSRGRAGEGIVYWKMK